MRAFVKDYWTKWCTVSLDGVDITCLCCEASEEEGYALCNVLDEHGGLTLKNGEINREKRFGKVVIGIRDDALPYVKDQYNAIRKSEEEE
jgi:hypothetical protein